jgi:hypothetical protein
VPVEVQIDGTTDLRAQKAIAGMQAAERFVSRCSEGGR